MGQDQMQAADHERDLHEQVPALLRVRPPQGCGRDHQVGHPVSSGLPEGLGCEPEVRGGQDPPHQRHQAEEDQQMGPGSARGSDQGPVQGQACARQDQAVARVSDEHGCKEGKGQHEERGQVDFPVAGYGPEYVKQGLDGPGPCRVLDQGGRLFVLCRGPDLDCSGQALTCKPARQVLRLGSRDPALQGEEGLPGQAAPLCCGELGLGLPLGLEGHDLVQQVGQALQLRVMGLEGRVHLGGLGLDGRQVASGPGHGPGRLRGLEHPCPVHHPDQDLLATVFREDLDALGLEALQVPLVQGEEPDLQARVPQRLQMGQLDPAPQGQLLGLAMQGMDAILRLDHGLVQTDGLPGRVQGRKVGRGP